MTITEWVNTHGSIIIGSEVEMKIGQIFEEGLDEHGTQDFIRDHPFIVKRIATKEELLAQSIKAGFAGNSDNVPMRIKFFYEVTTD